MKRVRRKFVDDATIYLLFLFVIIVFILGTNLSVEWG